MDARITIDELSRKKRDGERIVTVVAWDHEIARIADRAGVDIVSVGDSVGVNLWGRDDPLDISMDEMVLVARAVRRGVERALVSCDFPYGPLQEGPDQAVAAARRLVDEAAVDIVKLDGASSHLDAVAAVAGTGIPVFAQFGITPQTSARSGLDFDAVMRGGPIPAEMTDAMVDEARKLEAAGASLLNLSQSGPIVGPAVVAAVSIPVLGGVGGGPWLDGRIRLVTRAIGYAASNLDTPLDTYANVARTTLEAITAFAEDVRTGRTVKGEPSSVTAI